MPRKRKPNRFKFFLLGAVLGAVIAGGAIWLMRRVPSPTNLSFLRGIKPVQSGLETSDSTRITVWQIPGSVDSIKNEAIGELPDTQGWQPPVLRQSNPRTWQIVRVVTPNGNFQFTRWVFVQLDPQTVQVGRFVGPTTTKVPDNLRP